MAAFNIITCLYDGTAYIGERFLSFFNTLVWNLSGYDQYYVFQDNCPMPIPYRAFMLGGTGRYKWYYNTRSREFEAWIDGAKREYLPALSISIRQNYIDEEGPNNRYEYDLTKWLDTVKFKTVPNFFPHPMQIVAAWSLHSGVWPSFVFKANKQTYISMMSGIDGDIREFDVSTTISGFRWREFIGAAESEEESESEDTEASEEESTEATEEESLEVTEETSEESEEEEESESEKVSGEEIASKSVSEGENTKALFLAGGTDEIPTWANDWTFMPSSSLENHVCTDNQAAMSSMITFMSTLNMYDLPLIDSYTPTFSPNMEDVD